MWLGRADLGFVLADPPNNGVFDINREQRAAAALTLLFEQQHLADALRAMSETIDFLVGSSDDVTAQDVTDARRRSGLQTLEDLANASKLANFDGELKAVRAAGASQIRSQGLPGSRHASAAIPLTFQLLGQRFTLDSFLLSQFVFDSISFRGKRPERMLPSGLDVMAALGNDTALQFAACRDR